MNNNLHVLFSDTSKILDMCLILNFPDLRMEQRPPKLHKSNSIASEPEMWTRKMSDVFFSLNFFLPPLQQPGIELRAELQLLEGPFIDALLTEQRCHG